MTESTTDPWTPASESGGGDYLDLKDVVGRALLITPRKYLENQKTKFKADADVVVADIVVLDLDKPTESEKHTDSWILQGRLIGKTKGKVGNGMVLGRLITEPTDKGNPAYDLADCNEAETAAARAYYAAAEAPPF